MSETILAKPGEKLVMVQGPRLQLVGSEPAEFRFISIDRKPTLLIDDHETTPMYLPEAGGSIVSVPWQKNLLRIQDLPEGTRIEVVSYEVSEADFEVMLKAQQEAERKSGYVLGGRRHRPDDYQSYIHENLFEVHFGNAMDDSTAIQAADECVARERERTEEGYVVSATLWKHRRLVKNYPADPADAYAATNPHGIPVLLQPV